MEAVAQHDFQANEDGELSFKKGDILNVLNYGDQVTWYTAEFNGRRGIVPGNYIEVNAPRWYYGRVSRAEAETLLRSRAQGSFLVRLSESSPQDFSLSVNCGPVQHFRILKDSNFKYALWHDKFDSINKLVEHYKIIPVNINSEIENQIFLIDNQMVVRAKYDFHPNDDAEAETELEFKQGEIITVFDSQDDNWWGGSIGERKGYFPKTYVEEYRVQNNMLSN